MELKEPIGLMGEKHHAQELVGLWVNGDPLRSVCCNGGRDEG